MEIKPYEQNSYTPVPSAFTKFRRNCVPWQFIRFIAINIKMTVLILKSHH